MKTTITLATAIAGLCVAAAPAAAQDRRDSRVQPGSSAAVQILNACR